MGKNDKNLGAGISEKDLADLYKDETPAIPAQAFEALQEQVRALLQANAEKDKRIEELTGPDADEPGAANVSRASSKTRFAIMVEEGNQQDDEPGVFVQCNGRSYQILRGQRAEVPPEVVEILEHAVVERHIPIKDEHGQTKGTTIRPSRRFPFQNFGRVIDENGVRLQ